MSITGAPATGTPKEANARYEAAVTPMLIKKGGYPVLTGSTTKVKGGQGPESDLMVYRPDLDNWDRVLVVRYPGRRTFLELVTNPERAARRSKVLVVERAPQPAADQAGAEPDRVNSARTRPIPAPLPTLPLPPCRP